MINKSQDSSTRITHIVPDRKGGFSSLPIVLAVSLAIVSSTCAWAEEGRSPIRLLANGKKTASVKQKRGLVPKSEPTDEGRIRLPKDNTKPVIVFDWVNPNRKSDHKHVPQLQILGDGTVQLAGIPGIEPPVTGALTEDELQTLLRQILLNLGFANCNSAELEKEVMLARRKTNKLPRIPGAVSTRITVTTAEGRWEATFEALAMSADQFPDMRELQQLAAVERLLRHQMVLVRIGGFEEARKWAAAANRELDRKGIRTRPIQVEDLMLVHRDEKGSSYVQFRQPGESPEAGLLIVSILREPGQAAEFEITQSQAPLDQAALPNDDNRQRR